MVKSTASIDSISLVIPAHNEAENIAGVVRDSREALLKIAPDWEIVLVDDGSTDSTVAVAREALGDDAKNLTVVRHERKSGYGRTVCDGLRAARGSALAFMDGDGQFKAEDLVTLASHLDEADLVGGWRTVRADPWQRSVISGVMNILVRTLYGLNVKDVDCGLKVMRREVFADASPILAKSALFNTELYFKARRSGLRVRQFGVPHYPRLAGRRSGGRLIPILRAVRDVIRLRVLLARRWSPPVRIADDAR